LNTVLLDEQPNVQSRVRVTEIDERLSVHLELQLSVAALQFS
jgi:hypothetical protein